MESARALVSVQAGVVPGHPEEGLVKRYVLTTREWEAGGGDALASLVAEATGYAGELMNRPDALNWVTLEWAWL